MFLSQEILPIWCVYTHTQRYHLSIRNKSKHGHGDREKGGMTIYRAVKLYKIPKVTLFKNVKGSREVKSWIEKLLSASIKRKICGVS